MKKAEKEELLHEFLAKWTTENVRQMTLEQYVVGEGNQTFCYWVETETRHLGSIKGQNAFIFGIYKRKEKLKKHTGSYKSDGEYSWLAKFGQNRDEAFENVKTEILRVIEYAENGKFSLIENVGLHPFFKWKVAFLYSNKRLIPIYEKRVLDDIATHYGLTVTPETTISGIQDLMIQNKPSHLDFYEFTDFLWKTFSEERLEDKSALIPGKRNKRKASEINITDTQIRKVSERTYRVDEKHKRLQKALETKLISHYGQECVVLFEENNVDVKLFESNLITFYEVKTDADPSKCIREGLGQLLSYYFTDENPQKKKLVVVGQYPLNKSDKEFVGFVKKSLNIEFDYENIELS